MFVDGRIRLQLSKVLHMPMQECAPVRENNPYLVENQVSRNWLRDGAEDARYCCTSRIAKTPSGPPPSSWQSGFAMTSPKEILLADRLLARSHDSGRSPGHRPCPGPKPPAQRNAQRSARGNRLCLL